MAEQRQVSCTSPAFFEIFLASCLSPNELSLSLRKFKFYCLIFNPTIIWGLWEGASMIKQSAAVMLSSNLVGCPASLVIVVIIFFMWNTETQTLSTQVSWRNWLLGWGIWTRTVLVNLEHKAVSLTLLSILHNWYFYCGTSCVFSLWKLLKATRS